MSQFLCSQGLFVLVLLSGVAHKPQDAGFDAGEPGNGADGPVGCLWPMVGDNLGAVNLEGAVRVTEVTQADEACSIPVLFIKPSQYPLQNHTCGGGVGVG